MRRAKKTTSVTATVVQGDMREVLAGMPECSVDSVVCDPPYELGFMGKSWDAAGVAFDPKTWRAVYRVLKPGGHLVAFGGTRTHHRMMVAVEDAGFDTRDVLMWLQGQGFSKGTNISKAIDKQRYNRKEILQVTAWIRSARDAAGITNAEIDEAFGYYGMAGCHWTSSASQPAVPTLDQIPILLKVLKNPVVPEEMQRLLYTLNGLAGEPGPNWWKREVTGHSTGGIQLRNLGPAGYKDAFDITAPATPEAEQWQGWHTGLKPAFEPIVLARKPVSERNVAANVLRWGTGAINVGACRVGMEERINQCAGNKPGGNSLNISKHGIATAPDTIASGRWPANLILSHDPRCVQVGTERVRTSTVVRRNTGKGGNPLLGIPTDLTDKRDMTHADGPDGCEGVDVYACVPGCPVRMLDEQSGQKPSSARPNSRGKVYSQKRAVKGAPDEGHHNSMHSDSGTASRFFYTPKTSSSERILGCPPGFANRHPTVKPLALMRWLVRLVTPPSGTVLDPFTGSGSTLVAAFLEGFASTGVELEAESVECARGRIAAAEKYGEGLTKLKRVRIPSKRKRLPKRGKHAK